MRSACALRIISGIIIYNFGIAERLRTLRYPIFTGGFGTNPLRRSRARFPLLSPTVTSSPGAGEVFPQRESQAVTFVAKVLGIMRKLPAVLLPLPLGEVDLRSKDGEGARR